MRCSRGEGGGAESQAEVVRVDIEGTILLRVLEAIGPERCPRGLTHEHPWPARFGRLPAKRRETLRSSCIWYQDMADFADQISAERAGRRLARAIQGQGAFRRFKAQLHEEHPQLLPAWYAFRDARAYRRAVEWLADNSLVHDDAATRFLDEHPETNVPRPGQPPEVTGPGLRHATVTLSDGKVRRNAHRAADLCGNYVNADQDFGSTDLGILSCQDVAVAGGA